MRETGASRRATESLSPSAAWSPRPGGRPSARSGASPEPHTTTMCCCGSPAALTDGGIVYCSNPECDHPR